jgi:hypothetical protein
MDQPKRIINRKREWVYKPLADHADGNHGTSHERLTPIDMHQLLGNRRKEEEPTHCNNTPHLTTPHALIKGSQASLGKITRSIGTAQLRLGACIACIIKEPERV